MRIALPGVPYQVKYLYVSPSEISVSNPAFNIVWPYETPLNIELYGDGNWSTFTSKYFFTWFNESYPIGSDAQKELIVNHKQYEKAQFQVNLTEPDPANPVVRLLHYGEKSSFYQGNVPVYLPKGMYNFNFALVNDGSFSPSYNWGVKWPASSSFSGVDLNGSEFVTRDYSLTGGLGSHC